jgi:hypothetical protein
MDQPVFDLSRHGHESLLNISGILGRRLEERNTDLICKRLSSEEKSVEQV